MMLDLAAVAGDRFRFVLDSSYEVSDRTRDDRLWCARIECAYGHIYPHGPNALGAWPGRRMMVSKLISIPGVRIRQRGDAEVTVVFPPDLLDTVCDVLKARRRRRTSDQQREVIKARLAPYQFSRR